MTEKLQIARQFIEAIPHSRALGMGLDSLEAGVAVISMPYDLRFVGDPATGVIHGGAVSALMDTASGAAVITLSAAATATLDLRIDYMRAATPGQRIRARRFVIATGSHAVVPPIPGIDGIEVLTNETIFALRDRPDHLLILGGGPIGMEMAQAHRRLGCRVTVIEAARALGRDDSDCAAVLLAAPPTLKVLLPRLTLVPATPVSGPRVSDAPRLRLAPVAG